MFHGLHSLEYLYFEYNEIREIQPAAFSLMPSLQLVFLNNNLLRTLPVGAFAGTSLTRLNLRNNYFHCLPVSGVLEHLHAVVQIDLNQNPWDCSCDIIPLKEWLDTLSLVVIVGEVVCKTPELSQEKIYALWILKWFALSSDSPRCLLPNQIVGLSPCIPRWGRTRRKVPYPSPFSFSACWFCSCLPSLLLLLFAHMLLKSVKSYPLGSKGKWAWQAFRWNVEYSQSSHPPYQRLLLPITCTIASVLPPRTCAATPFTKRTGGVRAEASILRDKREQITLQNAGGEGKGVDHGDLQLPH